MRHTIIVATLASVAASVLTTAVISGSLFGADTASSANAPIDAEGAVSPGSVEGILHGDINCDGVVDAYDALGDLRYVAGLDVQQVEPCSDIGTLAATAGLSEFEYVVVATESNTDATKFVTAPCPEGKKLISGGFDIAGATDVVVRRNAAGGGWFVEATKLNFSLTPWSLSAQAHCAVFSD